jgi:hypothetical protein
MRRSKYLRKYIVYAKFQKFMNMANCISLKFSTKRIFWRKCRNILFLSFLFFDHFKDFLNKYLRKLKIFLLGESFRKQFTLSYIFPVIFAKKQKCICKKILIFTIVSMETVRVSIDCAHLTTFDDRLVVSVACVPQSHIALQAYSYM